MTTNAHANRLIAREDWEGLRTLAAKQLDRQPTHHYWLAQLSSALYELRRYPEAVEVAWKAEGIMPDCPLVLWHLAGPLRMLDCHACLAVLERLRALLVEHPERILCDEGETWNADLLRDTLAIIERVRQERRDSPSP